MLRRGGARKPWQAVSRGHYQGSSVLGIAVLVIAVFSFSPRSVQAFEAKVLQSVVSVLPLWPGHAQGGQPQVPPGSAPEGTAVAILPGGYFVTALHVVEKATAITLRLPDGRHIPAELVGRDRATDLALLKAAAELPVLPDAPEPALGAPVCAVGNQFGLGLSVTCGVVSALHRSGTGFNAIEDFVQTDASANPGVSGGALVDGRGRLVGIVSAIFTKDSDADIGINFAASIALVRRVVTDLAAHGRVKWAKSGLRAADLNRDERGRLAGARVTRIQPGSAAARAGLRAGDLLHKIGERPVRRASDVTGALALARPGARLELEILRKGNAQKLTLELPP